MIIPTKLLLAKRATKTKKGKKVRRISVEFDVWNYCDKLAAKMGRLNPSRVRRARISGVVDSGIMDLVLPEKVVKKLGVPRVRGMKVRYADRQRASRDLVDEVHLELLGRRGTFQAVVEPRRKDALIGGIVLRVLDLLPDRKRERLVRRDQKFLHAEL